METFGLFSLEYWKLRDDLMDVYKMMRGIDNVDSQSFSSE